MPPLPYIHFHIHIHTIFLHYITSYPILAYSLVFAGMVLMGEEVLFAVAFLTWQGFFEIWSVLIAIALGIILGDMFWFFLGKKLGEKNSWRISQWICKATNRFENHLKNKTFHTIFFSKFVYCANHIVILRAGMLNLSFKTFLKSDLVASAVWILVIGGIGYFAGSAYYLVRHYVRFVEVALLLALLGFVIADKIVGKTLETKL